MSAHGIPADPTFPTDSEREVWERLLAQGGDDWTLLANVRLTDEKKDHELDVVVLMPDVGVLVLEVKGGQVRVEGDEWVTGTGEPPARHPPREPGAGREVRAAALHRDATRGGSRAAGRGCASGMRSSPPTPTLADDFATPDCPRWMIHGRDDQADLAGRLCDIAARQESGHRVPTLDDCDAHHGDPEGRNLPQRTMLAEADERERRADRLTVEQATILGVTRLLNRVEVRGGAGSGKTVLAMTQAKQLTRGIHGMPGRSGSRCSATPWGWRAGSSATWSTVDRRHRPAFVGTFEDLAAYLGVGEFGTRDDADFWEERPPAADGRTRRPTCPTARSSTRSSSTRPRTSPTCGGRRSCGACATRRRAGCTSTATRTSGCSRASGGRRCRWCRSCSTTTCATPGRSPRRSCRSRRCGCTPAVATGPR